MASTARRESRRLGGPIADESRDWNEQERAALRQQYSAVRAINARWQQDLRGAIPTARIVELPGANLYMFLSNEADVVRDTSICAHVPK